MFGLSGKKTADGLAGPDVDWQPQSGTPSKKSSPTDRHLAFGTEISSAVALTLRE